MHAPPLGYMGDDPQAFFAGFLDKCLAFGKEFPSPGAPANVPEDLSHRADHSRRLIDLGEVPTLATTVSVPRVDFRASEA